jgi:hypothetical protein
VIGPIKGVIQRRNASLDRWQKYSTKTGKLISTKISVGPYKNVAKGK